MHAAAVVSICLSIPCGLLAIVTAVLIAMRLCKPSAWYRVCLALSGSLVFLGLAPVLDVQGIKTGTGYIPTSAGEGAMFGEIACLAGVAILTLTLLVRFRVLKLS